MSEFILFATVISLVLFLTNYSLITANPILRRMNSAGWKVALFQIPIICFTTTFIWFGWTFLITGVGVMMIARLYHFVDTLVSARQALNRG